MEADEAGTLEMLRRYRAAMATLIERHDGRVVNTWGDAIIAEFPSVVEGLQCAVETQQELSTYNGRLPEPRRVQARKLIVRSATTWPGVEVAVKSLK
jgi:adenylate cyclase